jgi:extradiol dioxygenase family protein
MSLQPFHLAIPVNNLEKADHFYGQLLGFEKGRSDKKWIDWNFFGHQLVTHLKEGGDNEVAAINLVDGRNVPVPHFGVVLQWDEWHRFAEKIKTKNIQFIIEPYIRFKGKVGEQATMFFADPFNNMMEFKAFKNEFQLFAK